MEKELRILNLEDNAVDAELVERELRRHGVKCVFKVVKTQKDFVAALDEFGPDVILADYTLPSFNGLAALGIFRSRHPFKPFIFVTGTIGEEMAIDAVKNGASDYVYKNDLPRLASSLHRALSEEQSKVKLVDTLEVMKGVLEEKQALSASLEKLNRVLLTVSNCNQALVRATDEQQLMDDVCRVLTETGGYRMAWIGLAEHDAEKTVKPAAFSGHNEGYVEALNITWADTEQGQSPIGSAIRTGEPVVIRKIASDVHFPVGGGGA